MRARTGINPSDYTVVESGCWEWNLCLHRDGYGKVTVRQKTLGAHRFSYQCFKGELSPTMDIDHLCRNRKCINPDHLELVTEAQNTRRAEFVKLTPELVANMRAEIALGNRPYTIAKKYAEASGAHPMTAYYAAIGRSWRGELIA